MSLLKFYDRFPSKTQSVTAAGATYNISFPLQQHKLKDSVQDQTIYEHYLVND